jgi:hypothetical protein
MTSADRGLWSPPVSQKSARDPRKTLTRTGVGMPVQMQLRSAKHNDHAAGVMPYHVSSGESALELR